MALYEITGPNGAKYEIEGPEGATDQQLINAVQNQIREEERAQRQAELEEARRPLERAVPEEDAGFIENVLTGVGSGAVGLFETAALGAATLLDEGNETEARRIIQEAADALTPEGGDKESTTYKLAQGVGSILGFLPTALLGPAALPAAGALGVGAAAGEASERAREAGATEEERSTASLMAAPVGLLEVTPLGRIAKALKIPVVGDTIDNLSDTVVGGITDRIGAGAMREIGDRVTNAAATGGLEGAQEAAAEIAQNLIQQGVYDPTKDTFGGVGEALAIGGGAGAIVQALVDTFAGRRARTPEGERQTPTEPTPTAEEGATAPRQADLFGDEVPAGTQMDMFAEELAAEQGVAPTEEAELSPADERQIDMFGEELGLTPEQIAEAKEAARQGELFDGQAPSAQVEPRLPRPKTEQELIEEQDFEQIAQRRTAQARQQAEEAGKRRDTFEDVLFTLRNQERGMAKQELDRLDQMETAEIEAMLADDARRDELITKIGERNVAELERAREVGPELQAREAETAQQRREAQRIASEAETAAGIETATTQELEASRREQALQDIIASDPKQTPDIRGTFQAVLESGNLPTQLTATEERMIRRAEDLRAAEETVPRQIPSTAEDTQIKELEAAVPARQPREEQLTLEGVPSRRQEKRAQRRPATEPQKVETAPEKRPVSVEQLDGMGIPKTAPVRKRVQGRDLSNATDQEFVRNQLTTFANAKSTRPETKFRITKFLEDAPDEQMEMFGPRGGLQKPTKAKRTKLAEGAGDVQPQRPEPTPTRTSVQDSEPSPRTRRAEPQPERAERVETPEPTRLESAERDTGVSDVREGTLPSTLEEAPAKPKKKITRRKAAETIQAVKPLPTTKTKRKPKAETTKQEAPAPAESTTTQKEVKTKDTTKAGPGKEQKAAPQRVAMKAASEADQKLRGAQDKVVANPLSALFNYNFRKVGRAVAKDTDKTTVASLLERVADPIKSKLNKKEPKNAARFYFGKKSRIEDTLELIAHDLAFGGMGKSSYQATTRGNLGQLAELEDVTSEAENAFFEGLGNAEVARAAQSWIVGNMSPEVAKKLQQRASHYAEMALNVDNMKGRDLVAEERELDAARAKLQKKIKKQATRDETLDKKTTRELEQAFAEDSEGYVEYVEALGDLESLRNDLNLVKDAVAASSLPLHPEVSVALEAGNLGKALQYIASTTQNNRVRNAAEKLAGVVGDTKVEVVENLKEAGSFDPETNTIKISAESGMNVHTVLHEMAHAATSATLANKSHPLTKQLTNLFESVKEELGTAYGATSLDEFVAEAFSNPRFRFELAGLSPKGDKFTALDRLNNALMNFLRKLFGMQTKPLGSALTEADALIENILAPAPASRNAGKLLLISREGPQAVRDAVNKYGTSVADITKAVSEAVNKNDFLRSARNFFSAATSKSTDTAKRVGLMFMPSQALADILGAYKITAAMDLHKLFEEQEGKMSQSDQKLDAVQKKLSDWMNANPEKKKVFDKLVHDSTIEHVDPTDSRSDYKGDSLAKYDELKRMLDEVGPEGKEMYTNLRDAYASLFDEMKRVIEGRIDNLTSVDDNGNVVPVSDEAKTELRNKIFSKMFDKAQIKPYFPLTRKGDFWLTYNIQTPDGTEPVVRAFETDAERRDAIATLKDMPEVIKDADGEPKLEITSSPSKIKFKNAPSTSFVGQTMQILNANGVSQQTKDEFLRLFVDALPETSFAKSLAKRKGTLGYQEDALLAFKLKAYDIGRQAVRLEYSRRMFNALDNANEQIKRNPELKSESLGKIFAEELDARVKFATNPPADPIAIAARNANRIAFLGTIGFNVSSAVVNLSQIPLVVLPFMAGKTSYKDAMKNLNSARRFMFGAGREHSIMVDGKAVKTKGIPSMDNYYDVNPDGKLSLRTDLDLDAEQRKTAEIMLPLVQAAATRGLLNRSMFYDSLGIEQSGKDKSWVDTLNAWSAFPFHTAERFNRQVTLGGTYLNELQRLTEANDKLPAGQKRSEAELQQEAVDTALYDTQQTNGGAVLSTAARIAQMPLGRVAMMYKGFGIQMYYTQFKTAKEALAKSDLTPEQRKIAFKQIMGIQGSVLFMSGVQGLTLYGMVAAVANMFLDDDEEDFETLTRAYLGEPLYKGGINQILAGLGVEVDVASRIGLSNLIIASNRYNFNPSMEKTIVETFGGPAYGYMSQVARGVGDMMDGEVQRGLENVLPSAFRNAAKATFRYADEGILTRRKDPILDDLNAAELTAQFFGFAPAEYTRNQERNQVLKRIEKAVNTKRTKLLRQYYIALRTGDREAIKEIALEMQKFNKRNPTVSITSDSIQRSMRKHAQTSATMYNGVTLSPKLRTELEQIGEGFDETTPWFLR